MFNLAKEYLTKIEVEKSNSIMYNKDVLLSNFTEKEDLIFIFKIILAIYESALNGNYNHKIKGSYDWISYLSYVSYVTSVEDAIEKGAKIDLLVDFTQPDSVFNNAKICLNNKIKIVANTRSASQAVRLAETLKRLGYVTFDDIQTETLVREGRQTRIAITVHKTADFDKLYKESLEKRKQREEERKKDEKKP